MIRLLKSVLLMMGCCLVAACSTGDGDYSDDATADVDNSDIKTTAGYYGGVWSIDGKTVAADPLVSSTPYPSYVYLGFDEWPYLSFVEFPYKAIAKTFFPDVDIAKLTAELPLGVPFNAEQRLLFSVDSLYHSQGEDAMMSIYTTRLRYVGYSEDMAYLELVPDGQNAYVHYAFVVTTTSGDYFALVLDVATWRTLDVSAGVSTVNLSLLSPSMSLLLVVRSMNLYDRDLKRTEKALVPDKLVRFNSNQKSDKVIYK